MSDNTGFIAVCSQESDEVHPTTPEGDAST
jgi:hypothetical protein